MDCPSLSSGEEHPDGYDARQDLREERQVHEGQVAVAEGRPLEHLVTRGHAQHERRHRHEQLPQTLLLVGRSHEGFVASLGGWLVIQPDFMAEFSIS